VGHAPLLPGFRLGIALSGGGSRQDWRFAVSIYSLEAWRRYREEKAENPAEEGQHVPDTEQQTQHIEADAPADDDDDADDFEDIFELWTNRNMETFG
jgi:hypothetical protein